MKVLKQRGKYLETESKKNLKITWILLVISLVDLLVFLQTWNLIAFFLLFPILLAASRFNKSHKNFEKGLRGEKLVSKILLGLSDEYYLMDDLKNTYDGGNIDHVVLGPNGIFVIETKTYSGEIFCWGDKWKRRYQGKRYTYYDLDSPSKQAKRNAIRIKQIVDSSGISGRRIWVHAIVVFATKNVELHLKYPTVPILNIDELCDYIVLEKPSNRLSAEQLASIGRVISASSRY